MATWLRSTFSNFEFDGTWIHTGNGRGNIFANVERPLPGSGPVNGTNKLSVSPYTTSAFQSFLEWNQVDGLYKSIGVKTDTFSKVSRPSLDDAISNLSAQGILPENDAEV
jgi:hypothetical protein